MLSNKCLLCVMTGPWFVGELLNGYVGACFVYGMYVNGSHVPGGLTYILGSIQVSCHRLP